MAKNLHRTRLLKGCCHCYQPRQKLLGVFERMNCVSWHSSVSFYQGQGWDLEPQGHRCAFWYAN